MAVVDISACPIHFIIMLSWTPLTTALTPKACLSPLGDLCFPSGIPASTISSFISLKAYWRLHVHIFEPALAFVLCFSTILWATVSVSMYVSGTGTERYLSPRRFLRLLKVIWQFSLWTPFGVRLSPSDILHPV